MRNAYLYGSGKPGLGIEIDEKLRPTILYSPLPKVVRTLPE